MRKSRIQKGEETQAKNISNKLREHYVPLIESQMIGYSPSRVKASRPSHSPLKSRAKAQTTKSKYDGDYENLSRKVA